MSFFTECHTPEQLRAEFKRLVLKHHPDRGGSEDTMKQVNADYEAASKRVVYEASAADEAGAWSDKKTAFHVEMNEKLRVVLEALMLIPDIEVELSGLWFWIDGCPAPVKRGEERPCVMQRLYDLKCRYSFNKGRWYFPGTPTSGRGKAKMGEIRAKYGSSRVKGGGRGAQELEA